MLEYRSVALGYLLAESVGTSGRDPEELIGSNSIFKGIEGLEDGLKIAQDAKWVYPISSEEGEIYKRMFSFGDPSYFPEEKELFKEWFPNSVDHHEHFFGFWKKYRAHRGFHNAVGGLAEIIEGKYFNSLESGYASKEDMVCLGYPGSPNQLPEVEMIFKLRESVREIIGMDPCFGFVNNVKVVSSNAIFMGMDRETNSVDFSVLTLPGRIFLDRRPNPKTGQLGSKYLRSV